MLSSIPSYTLPDLLGTLLPGIPFISSLASLDHVYISSYSSYIYPVIAFWTFANFVVPKLYAILCQLCLYLCVSTEIEYQGDLYHYAMRWISYHWGLSQTRRFISTTRTSYSTLWYDQDEDDDAEAEREINFFDKTHRSVNDPEFWQELRYISQKKPVISSPMKDETHYFWYKNCLFFLYRQSIGDCQNVWLAHAENLRIYTAPWNRSTAIQLLETMQEDALQQKYKLINVYEGMKFHDYFWRKMISKLPRPLSTIMLDKGQKEMFVNDVRKFLLLETRHKYYQRHIPYQRGYLFHGPPGTGKSSLCSAIAGVVGLDVYTVSLNNLDQRGLSLLLLQIPRRCILLIEDIDTAGIERDGKSLASNNDDDMSKIDQKQAPISFAALLNAIDGVGTREGRILIMTTNHKEKLDSALIRPGRVDMEVSFEFASECILREFFLDFYALENDKANETFDGTNEEKVKSLSVEFAKHIPPGEFSTADIQNYFLQHEDNPEAAVQGASEWVKQKRSETKNVP